MTRLLLALVLLCWPGVALAKFAPVDGQVWRFSLADERGDVRRTQERRIVFHKAAQGYTADLTIVVADTGAGDIGAMAARVVSALTGRTIRYDLNDQGMVVGVEDQDALMATLVAAFGAMGSAGKDASPERQAVAAQAAAMLGALPYDAKRLLLAALLTPAIGGALSDAQPGEAPVSLPAGSPLGQSTELKGRQIVSRGADGRLIVDTDVSGPAANATRASLPGAGMVDPAAVPMLRIVQHREIDAATGLVLVNERRADSWLSTKPDAITTIRARGTLTPVS